MKKTNKKDKWTGKVVFVGWKHIAKGEPEEMESCPIALALREQGARDVEVDGKGIKVGNKRYALPARAGQFVEDFDSDRTSVKPIEFKVGKLTDIDDATRDYYW